MPLSHTGRHHWCLWCHTPGLRSGCTNLPTINNTWFVHTQTNWCILLNVVWWSKIYTPTYHLCAFIFKRHKSTVTFRYYSTWWLLASRLKNKQSLIWLSVTNQHSRQSHHLIATILHHTYVNIRVVSAVTSPTSILAEKQLEVCSLHSMIWKMSSRTMGPSWLEEAALWMTGMSSLSRLFM